MSGIFTRFSVALAASVGLAAVAGPALAKDFHIADVPVSLSGLTLPALTFALSIDRVLRNHPLDGVYFDWNAALFCCNPLHEGKSAKEKADGHWDIDGLLDLIEWTRKRIGPDGLLIIRYLFGLRDAALIQGAIATDATRKTAADVEAYILSLMP